MPTGVYIPAFSPESKIECCAIWQVFWLGYNWTPSRWCFKTNQQWYEDSVGQWSIVKIHQPLFTIHNLTATGIAPDFLWPPKLQRGWSPDFPFNPLIIMYPAALLLYGFCCVALFNVLLITGQKTEHQ